MSNKSVFDRLIDQSDTVAVLKQAVVASRDSTDESQDMTHAWLFTGPPGSGRSNAALAFAAALVCADGGCGDCVDCRTALTGSHADVELIQTEGLSIKIDEIRELITRAAWTPSVATYRVVVMEDADRLTESAANALLKAVEEPSTRTIWLLCAPTVTDVLPTIRSRTRNLTLRTPSATAVSTLLQGEGISVNLANFAAAASQGHIGRARYLARDQSARDIRNDILKLPTTIVDVASAFAAAARLVDAAKSQAEEDAEKKNDGELAALKEAWGQQGTRVVTGGAKAVKELEREQKSRQTRMVRDYLDRALLDIATLYRDVLLTQTSSGDELINPDLVDVIRGIAGSTSAEKTLEKIEVIMKTRANLLLNAAPLLVIEAMMVQLR
jgi:DNA polymerase III subunit delta'